MKKYRPFAKCRLCQNESYLIKSHLLPASLYRILRSDTPGHQDTYVVTGEMALSTSLQLAHYLLCPACEDRFNKYGERWVMANCYRKGSTFPLYDILNSAAPLQANDRLRVYAAQSIPVIDVGRLIYFAASVFWRATVSSWQIAKKKIKPLDLGTACQEQFRKFLLLDGPFPPHTALVIFVSLNPQPPLVAYPPFGGRGDTCHGYRFVIPGISFFLAVGKRIPDFPKNICVVRSEEQFILMSESYDQKMFDETLALFKLQYERNMRGT